MYICMTYRQYMNDQSLKKKEEKEDRKVLLKLLLTRANNVEDFALQFLPPVFMCLACMLSILLLKILPANKFPQEKSHCLTFPACF